MRRLAALFALVPAAAAQVSVTCPRILKDSAAAGGMLLPAGRTKSFVQTWYHGSNVPPDLVVTRIGWRYDQSASFPPGFTHAMEIVLDSTPATFATLSPVFARNLSARPTVFLPLTSVNWPAPNGSGHEPAMWIPGAVPFHFRGPHFLVQVDVRTEPTPRTLADLRVDAYTVVAAAPYLTQAGSTGCAAATLAAVGSGNGALANIDFRLRGGPPNSAVLFMLGFENQVMAGSNRLPVDLGFLGMAGCSLGVAPLAALALVTDESGGADVRAPLAVTAEPQHLFAQGLLTGGGGSGLVTTNVAGAAIGSVGLSNHLYSWTVFGGSAEFGPFPSNRAAVCLLR